MRSRLVVSNLLSIMFSIIFLVPPVLSQSVNWALVPGGGFTPSSPAVTGLDDDLALFVRGEDNQLYVNFTVTGP